MTAAAPMKFLGEFEGRKCYLAEAGTFVRPGIYFWDGKNNVHVSDTVPMSSAVAAEIAAERDRQIAGEGYSYTHDDEHTDGSLALAAAAYAKFSTVTAGVREGGSLNRPNWWPWHPQCWKPKDRRSDLVRAGALIVAEIERLDRAAAKDGTNESR